MQQLIVWPDVFCTSSFLYVFEHNMYKTQYVVKQTTSAVVAFWLNENREVVDDDHFAVTILIWKIKTINDFRKKNKKLKKTSFYATF